MHNNWDWAVPFVQFVRIFSMTRQFYKGPVTFSVEVIVIQQIIENILFMSWKNVIFVPLSTWKSVRKSDYLYWKSVFLLGVYACV